MKTPATKKAASKKAPAAVAKVPKTASERVIAARHKVVAAGGRLMNLTLKKDAADALAILEADGKPAVQIISDLLIAAAKRKRCVVAPVFLDTDLG